MGATMKMPIVVGTGIKPITSCDTESGSWTGNTDAYTFTKDYAAVIAITGGNNYSQYFVINNVGGDVSTNVSTVSLAIWYDVKKDDIFKIATAGTWGMTLLMLS